MDLSKRFLLASQIVLLALLAVNAVLAWLIPVVLAMASGESPY